MKRIWLLCGALLLVACAGSPDSEIVLQHRWVLVAVDGAPVATDVRSDLTVSAPFKVSGRAGCNRFFGTVRLRGDVLEIDQLGVTAMACAPDVQKVENVVLNTLKYATFILANGQLRLKGRTHLLTYQRAD